VIRKLTWREGEKPGKIMHGNSRRFGFLRFGKILFENVGLREKLSRHFEPAE
jgi:hypothetical protein